MKNKLAVWMVVRDDEYYIELALKSVLPYADGIYILDNGSTDKTIKLIESFKSDKIFLEKIKYNFERPDFDKGDHTWTHPYWQWNEKYDGDSLEAQTRNLCVRHCIERFSPDWLIQLDADEVYTPLFFQKLSELDLTKISAIRHSTDCFLTKNIIMRRPNEDAFDSHYRSWNPKLNIQWKKTNRREGHVGPKVYETEKQKFYWMDGIVHIHLHRTFGPKTITKEETNELLKGSIKKVDFDWHKLDFVITKWRWWESEHK